MLSKQKIKSKLMNTGFFKDCIYLDNYSNLICFNLNRKKNEEGSTELHHIQPRCIYKKLGQLVDDSKDNKVNLLYKDHIMAHYYLCLACSDINLFYHLYMPLYFMLDNKKFSQNKLSQVQQLLIEKIEILQKLKTALIENQNKKDKEFYDLVNFYLKKGYDYSKIGEIVFNKKTTTIATRYLKYCNQYGWKNWNTNKTKKRFVVSKDKEFYNLVNAYLEQGKTFYEISEILGLSSSAASTNYQNICKRNHWSPQHRNAKLTPKRKPCNLDLNKTENIQFHQMVSSMLKQKRTYKEIAEILEISSKKVISRYLWCCKRYNLKNYNTHFWKPTFNKQRDIELYNLINKYLSQQKTFDDISLILNKKPGYAGSMYSRICKRWKLPNKTLNGKWNETEDKKYYYLINSYLKQGLTYSRIDKLMKKNSGYTASEYPRIIKHYKWPNMNPRADDKVNWSKEKKIKFYKIISCELQTKSFARIAKDIGMNYHNLKSWYYRICHEFNLENQNPRQK